MEVIGLGDDAREEGLERARIAVRSFRKRGFPRGGELCGGPPREDGELAAEGTMEVVGEVIDERAPLLAERRWIERRRDHARGRRGLRVWPAFAVQPLLLSQGAPPPPGAGSKFRHLHP